MIKLRARAAADWHERVVWICFRVTLEPTEGAELLGGSGHRPLDGGDAGSEGDGQVAHAPGVESTPGMPL
jgi:hypothetical protein